MSTEILKSFKKYWFKICKFVFDISKDTYNTIKDLFLFF